MPKEKIYWKISDHSNVLAQCSNHEIWSVQLSAALDLKQECDSNPGRCLVRRVVRMAELFIIFEPF